MTGEQRPLTAVERSICEKLLERDFRGRDGLRAQLKQIGYVVPINDDQSIIEFSVPEYSRPKGPGQTAIPVEGQYADKDGEPVMMMLFIDGNGVLYQLERYKFEGEIQEWCPASDAITLIGP